MATTEEETDKSMEKIGGKRLPNKFVWDTGFELLEECPYMDAEVTVHLPVEVYNKIEGLVDRLDTEWVGFFIGERIEDDAYIEDLLIPEQVVGRADCEATEFIEETTIGIIHSHGSIGAFHSGKDEHGAVNQNGFSIVVDSDMDIDAIGRTELPCGSMAKVPTKVVLTHSEGDCEEWLEEVTDKITESKWKSTASKGKFSKASSKDDGEKVEQWRNFANRYPYY